MSPERFAEFNAETRRLRRELARQEEEVAQLKTRRLYDLSITCFDQLFRP